MNASAAEIEARREYDILAPIYDRRWRRYIDATLRAILERVVFQGQERVLDIPCGTGELERMLFSRWPRLDVVGVDISPGMLRQADAKLRGECVSWVQADAIHLPFPDEYFDCAICANSFHYFRSPLASAREFHRVLRPGGWLVLRAAAFQTLRSRHSQYVAERHRYRAGELLRKLAAANFQVVRWSYANSFLSPIAWFKFRVWENLLREKPHSGVAATLPPWLNRLLLSALRTEANLLRAGFRFVFGQSLMAVARKPK